VVERRNMTKFYIRGELALRVSGGVCFRGCFELEFFFAFSWFAAFLAICWFYDFSFWEIEKPSGQYLDLICDE
jgi:hypothetical protein